MTEEEKTINSTVETHLITVTGLVQGVGFRPYIYRTASENNLSGWVRNMTGSVLICIQGDDSNIKNFLEEIETNPPRLSSIISIDTKTVLDEMISGFSINSSHDTNDAPTQISPDIAVCAQCLDDIRNQGNRINYPFVNCTNCGPRFSIIYDFPYDRSKTTMSPFPMCKNCETEYNDVTDRRFHAQPVACCDCGPELELVLPGKNIHGTETILKITSRIIEEGGIIALKGMGGFQLICNAIDVNAVEKLRQKKHRDGKPFAVMFSDITAASKYAAISENEKKIMASPMCPILLLKKISTPDLSPGLAEGVCRGLNTVGGILPYMPIHYLLMDSLDTDAIVFTSGNISSEPIIIDNEKAINELAKIADAVITYNRDIYNRSDDSIIRVVNDTERIMRRSRGYAPSPVNIDFNADGILAAGPELKNTFAIGKGNQVILSQHIGDLLNLETYEFYEKTIDLFKKLYRFEPELIAADMHPAYMSTGFAEKYANEMNIPILRIQHHHAHIASCMAEHRIQDKVIGVSLDGTGYGDDGKTWGSEFLICDLQGYDRFTHLDYMEMPGSDMAAREPWRMAVAYLYRTYGSRIYDLELPFFSYLDKKSSDLVISAIGKNINTPLTSSMGRLFDAVSAITGVCSKMSFEAEAPTRLESVLEKNEKGSYGFDLNETIKCESLISDLVNDVTRGVSLPVISARFHNTIVNMITNICIKIRNEKNINIVVFSGGIFQNGYVLKNAEKALEKEKFSVYIPRLVPANDGGISLGQVAVASILKNKK